MPASRRPTTAVWFLGLVAVAGAFIAAYFGFIRTTTGQVVDDSAMVAAQAFLQEDLTRRSALAFLGLMPHISAIAAAIVLGATAIARRRVYAPAVALLQAGAAIAASQVIKDILLDRPNLGVSEATMNSFPSGHTTVAAAAVTAIFLASSPRARPLVATFGGLYAAVAGAATYVLGWHRPADVLGAYLLAAFFGLVGGIIILREEPEWNAWRAGERRRAPSGFWQAVPWIPGVGCLAITVAIYLLVVRGHEADAAGPMMIWYLIGGLTLIVGSAMTVFALASSLMSWETRVRER